MVEGDQLVVPAKRASPLPKARYHKLATPIGVRGVTTHFPAPPVLPIFVSADFEPSELPKSFWYASTNEKRDLIKVVQTTFEVAAS